MGTGKTTLGKELGRLSKYTFIDLDQEIERLEGKSIAEIFASNGESYFRNRESDLLSTLLMDNREPMILATGGGAILKEENLQVMKENGFIVKTEATRDEIIRRLKFKSSSRPLLAGNLEERVDQLLTERKDAYDFADYTIHTDQMKIGEIARSVLSIWLQVNRE